MQSDIVVSARHLGKCYRVYKQPQDRLKQGILNRLAALGFRAAGGSGGGRYYREFWALRNVSLDVRRGETVGIVGRNGSGKSTFLQLVCGVLTQTEGEIRSRGRIGALLELGAGFNPEFSGRENVYLSAAIMGLDSTETEQRFADIIAFSELEAFVDQPLKTYSSGMYLRLAFSVAVHVNPDVLVIDEALSVGDEAFQRKCYARIQTLQDSGSSILLVSHSGAAITELCDRAVLLDRGELLFEGEPKDVVATYQKLIYAPADKADAIRASLRSGVSAAAPRGSGEQSPDVPPGRPLEFERPWYDGSLVPSSTLRYERRGVEIRAAMITTLNGEQVNVLVPRQEYRFSYQAHFAERRERVRLGMLIKTISGLELGGGVTAPAGQAAAVFEAETTVQVSFHFRCLLAPGTYFLNAGITGYLDGMEVFLDRCIDIAMFKVQPGDGTLATGTVDFDISSKIRQIGN